MVVCKKLENVILVAIEVVGTSLVVSVGGTGVRSMLGNTTVGLLTDTGATVGERTMDDIGIVVGRDDVSFDRIGAVVVSNKDGEVAVGTAGGVIVGKLGAARSHWKASQDLLSTAIHLNHGSTTLRH